MLVLVGTVALNVWLIGLIPKGFFPEQDTGRLVGSVQADQSISFTLMSQKLTQMIGIVGHDPAVQSVVGSTGSGSGGAAAPDQHGLGLRGPEAPRRTGSDVGRDGPAAARSSAASRAAACS